jgi:hypothetical protein
MCQQTLRKNVEKPRNLDPVAWAEYNAWVAAQPPKPEKADPK